MRRRDCAAMAAGGLALHFATASAQQPGRIARLGFLATAAFSLDAPDTLIMYDALRDGLRQLGYAEGANLSIEIRSAGGQIARLGAMAQELAALRVDVIIATNSLSALAARRATTTIPIVAAVMGDPVGDGLAASLVRPGGNVTGLTFIGPQLLPKRLELLKEVVPSAVRVAAIWHPGAYGEATMATMMREGEAAARSLGIQLHPVAVAGPEDFERAFTGLISERPDALIVYPSPMLFNERAAIVALIERHRLPSVAMAREYAELGGLLAYGASIRDLHRRAAAYVDRILKGANPATLPIEQPTTFELAINLRTARALGITVPASLLLRADEVIE